MSILNDLKVLTPNQRNVIVATFLGWTLDAFDFFIIVFVFKDIAKEFNTDIPSVTATLFLTFAMRPLGAFIFGRQKPVGADMIDNVLAKDINGLEPRLTRKGYNVKVLAELLNAKPREIKEFLRGQLAPGRTQELQNELLAAGIPL